MFWWDTKGVRRKNQPPKLAEKGTKKIRIERSQTKSGKRSSETIKIFMKNKTKPTSLKEICFKKGGSDKIINEREIQMIVRKQYEKLNTNMKKWMNFRQIKLPSLDCKQTTMNWQIMNE